MKKLLLRFGSLIFALVAISLASISGAFAQTDTVAIVNAGSSGSRLYVYAVDKQKHIVDAVCTCDYPVKLSDIVHDQPKIADFCKDLCSVKEFQSKIDLYILATAGMRTVDSTAAFHVYESLKVSPELLSKYRVEDILTISGQQEGAYAWIAANYDNHTLPGKDSVRFEQTRGILEIGGASMQIAFVPTMTSGPDIFPHKIYNLYSKSYLNGGVNAVYQAKKNAKDDNISDYDKYIEGLSAIKNYFAETIVFSGLGGTIKGVSKQSRSDLASYLRDYNEVKSTEDPTTHYVSNTSYLKWVLIELELMDNDKMKPQDSDWTKGAAYDIVINGVKPKAFNYDGANPN